MELLHRSLTFGISLIVATVAVGGGVQFSYKTVDDSKAVQEILYRESDSQVLGASSQGSTTNPKCPDTSPIIGWIDYRGKKTIKDNLPTDIEASSCFKDHNEANQAGFFL
ncbi:MAG: hypothetical protein AAGF07_02715 [Patescibacteria group bacterium]